MKLWIQAQGRDEDEEFSDGATYEVLSGGVLQVLTGSDVHLYSPAYWQRVTIDTRPASQRGDESGKPDEDIRWQ